MATRDWNQFISLISNEKAIQSFSDIKVYYGNNKYPQSEGDMVLTNRRIIHLNYKKTGFIRKTIVGYDKVSFELDLKKIEHFGFPKEGFSQGQQIYLNATPRLDINSEYDIFLWFRRDDEAREFYKLLSEAIQILRSQPVEIKHEVVQYNIVSKFEFTDGGILITCPYCGAPSSLQSNKRGVAKCVHCNNEYIIPKKILDLI